MKVQLSITEQCNLRCEYCYYKDIHARCDMMSDDVMEATVRLAFEKAIKAKRESMCITFFGGEPLLRFDFIRKTVKFTKKLIKELRTELSKKFRLDYSINTNGTLFTDEIVKYLKREKFTVFLSLDGPQKKHDISRRTVDGSGSFKALAPYLPDMAEMGAHVLMIVTRKHVKGLSDAVKWVFKQGFIKVSTYLDFDGSWTGPDFDALIPEYEKMARFWYRSQLEGRDIYLGTIQNKVVMNTFQIRQKNYSCFMNTESMFVATNGNVFPCSRFISSRKNAPYIVGNVFDKGSGVYKGVMPQAVRQFMETDRKECDGCAIRYRCSAHECGCTSFYTTGSLEGVSPEVCTHERILCAICDEYAVKLHEKLFQKKRLSP